MHWSRKYIRNLFHIIRELAEVRQALFNLQQRHQRQQQETVVLSSPEGAGGGLRNQSLTDLRRIQQQQHHQVVAALQRGSRASNSTYSGGSEMEMPIYNLD